MGKISHAAKMMGKFIQSPAAHKAYCGCEWRYEGVSYKRHYKRALAHFRRRDGKRWVREGLEAAYAENFDRHYQPRLDDENDDVLTWWEAYENDDDLYGCYCCRPEPCGCPTPEEHNYWADRDDYYNGSNEDRYQEEQARLDWGWEVHQEYLNGLEEGYERAGGQSCFLEGTCLGTRDGQHEHVIYGQSGSYIKAWNRLGVVVRDDRPWALTAS